MRVTLLGGTCFIPEYLAPMLKCSFPCFKIREIHSVMIEFHALTVSNIANSACVVEKSRNIGGEIMSFIASTDNQWGSIAHCHEVVLASSHCNNRIPALNLFSRRDKCLGKCLSFTHEIVDKVRYYLGICLRDKKMFPEHSEFLHEK